MVQSSAKRNTIASATASLRQTHTAHARVGNHHRYDTRSPEAVRSPHDAKRAKCVKNESIQKPVSLIDQVLKRRSRTINDEIKRQSAESTVSECPQCAHSIDLAMKVKSLTNLIFVNFENKIENSKRGFCECSDCDEISKAGERPRKPNEHRKHHQ